jgi:hypothetical protein
VHTRLQWFSLFRNSWDSPPPWASLEPNVQKMKTKFFYSGLWFHLLGPFQNLECLMKIYKLLPVSSVNQSLQKFQHYTLSLLAILRSDNLLYVKQLAQLGWRTPSTLQQRGWGTVLPPPWVRGWGRFLGPTQYDRGRVLCRWAQHSAAAVGWESILYKN